MNDMMTGAIATAFAASALFFLNYWRRSGERLFVFFALSFFVLAVNRVGFVLISDHVATGNLLYWVRFAAVAFLLIGILDKNRSNRPPGPKG